MCALKKRITTTSNYIIMELNKIFKDGLWSSEINVRDFVSHNITPYYGDASFLEGPTERTKAVWNRCLEALAEERENNGVRSLDNVTVSTITSHKAGYIDKENELIVGLQTDELLKRAIKPFGGINVVSKACHENGVEVDDRVKDIFTHYRKTHNDGVFDVYTEEIRSFRSLGFLTGLPDNYARGRIIGDYRRMALYGIDRLIEAKKEDLRNLTSPMTESRIRLREEVAEQIKALNREITTDASLGSGFRIGHSYFCLADPAACTTNRLRSVVEFDILPTLAEYWFDAPDKLHRWEENLRGVFNDD